jgi:hypothetical protein
MQVIFLKETIFVVIKTVQDIDMKLHTITV